MYGIGEENDSRGQFERDTNVFDQLPEYQVDDEILLQSPNPILSEIENLLMADDDDAVIPITPPSSESDYDKLLAEILAEPPLDYGDGSSPSNEDDVIAITSESDYDKLLAEILSEPPRDSDDGSSPSNEDSDKDRVDDLNPVEVRDEPVSKKETRQMRNRDAAMRSRERKKMYLKDLEMKSRYYEGECRRLGYLLQCCYAENHALRHCLQARGALGASMTKQESAVLLLESLLLGSLLWFMGIMCQPNLPLIMWLIAVLPRKENMEQKDLRRVARKSPGSDISKYFMAQSFAKSRRCRASRTKIKFGFSCALYSF